MAKYQDDNRYLRSGLVLSLAQHNEIAEILSDLTDELSAQFVLLTDVTGQIIAILGNQSDVGVVELASLVAGDLAASHEIARLTGQYLEHQMVVREGTNAHILISDAGVHLILFVQVSSEKPLGWTRMMVKASARQLSSLIVEEASLKPNIISDLEENDISDLVDDALDSVWLE